LTEIAYGCGRESSASESNENPNPLWPIGSNEVRVIQDAISISGGWDWTFLAMESRSCLEFSKLSLIYFMPIRKRTLWVTLKKMGTRIHKLGQLEGGREMSFTHFAQVRN